MKKEIIADVTQHDARVALLEDGELAEIQVELKGNERLVGNIYKGRVQNVLPGMQAAFVDIGLDKNAFLYVGDILADKGDFDFNDEHDVVDTELKQVNIRDIVKRGQEIIVQVLKQPGGAKGARITTHITLPGRHVVLMPSVDHIGVSRKIEDESERERLREIIEKYKPVGMGVIVRTAAVSCTEEELKRDIDFLIRLWRRIKKKSTLVSAPRLIHSEETVMFRTVRDMFTSEVDSFVINDREMYEKVLQVAEITQPEIAHRISFYEEKDNIFDHYGIEEAIAQAFERKVWLSSGAYLIIDEAEALTAIDVNTGKYIGDDDLQETIVNANTEAAIMIAKQIRLRDIGGIVIIDFIDMEDKANEDLIVEVLREALKRDRTKTNVVGFTGLGLVEMTRKKVRRRLSALLQQPCDDCQGSGKVMSPAARTISLVRDLYRTDNKMDSDRYLVEADEDIIAYIDRQNKKKIFMFEKLADKTVFLKQKPADMTDRSFRITALGGDKRSEDLSGARQMF